MAKKKLKRANNEGSVFQRPNKSWRGQVTIEGQRLSFTGKTQNECKEWIRKTLNQIDVGMNFQSTKIEINEFMAEWLASVESNVRPTTLAQYQQITRDYIIPAFDKIKIRDLRPDQIQKLYNLKLQNGLGERSVKTIHAVLHTALNHALKLGIIERNPASVAKPPRPNQKEMKFYDETQVQKFLITAKELNERYLTLYNLAITTGMRQGELLALKWDDIDWQRRTLKIQRQLKRKKGGGFRFSPPKSKAGKRTINLGQNTIRILRDHQNMLVAEKYEAGEKWDNQGLIFPNTLGKPSQPTKILKRFNNISELAGLPKIRFHDLRHTAAALMLNNNVPVIVVSQRLGHSQPSITLDVYGHLIPSMQKQVADLMDQITTPLEIQL